jgi:hypothetical protein
MRVSSPVSKHLAYMVSLFLETDYPGKVIMWWFLHLFSTSQYNSRSNHSGHACCYTNLNNLEHHLLCASSRYWWRCFRHQFLVSLFVWRLTFDVSSKGGPASSYATAGIALRVPSILKPPHHDKMEPPTRRITFHRQNIYYISATMLHNIVTADKGWSSSLGDERIWKTNLV